jgi:16S rRNA (cytosine1402-N4)-methyltransferase
MKTTVHTPVLLQEVEECLNIELGDTVVDGTVGGGGHAYALASKLSSRGVFVGIDLDPQALARAQTRTESLPCKKIFVEDNYRNLETILSENGIDSVNKVLIDLGLSSDQLDVSGRGFSFTRDEPLSMVFGQKGITFTAAEIVNEWDVENLTSIFQGYGEERSSWRIAQRIVQEREKTPIETTTQLVQVIESAIPAWKRKTARTHPATRIFQALRMAVNDEVRSLEEGLAAIAAHLAPGGRVAIITFESITDRIVKHTFRDMAEDGRGTVLTKKPIIPREREVVNNPRSRSAKLRVFEKN